MATDDTNTAARGECQVEVWGERVDAERSQILAPACGITDTLELDTAAARIQGDRASVTGIAAGLKWVPSNAVYATALGTIGLGVEAAAFWARSPTTEHWRAESLAIAGLASLAIGSAWNLYANLVSTHNLPDGKHVNGIRMAAAWQPGERWLLFVEGLASNDSRNLCNAGLRFWAVPGVLGLDVVTARSGTSGVSVSVGLGWYGLRLP
jgi:hypothetical protein